jgi:hypothetical protein
MGRSFATWQLKETRPVGPSKDIKKASMLLSRKASFSVVWGGIVPNVRDADTGIFS